MNWDDLISEQETLVFYMGLLALPTICKELIKHGMSKDMPIALIEQGTRLDQRTIKASLGTIVAKASLDNYVSPSLIIIGRVVELRDSLAWRD